MFGDQFASDGNRGLVFYVSINRSILELAKKRGCMRSNLRSSFWQDHSELNMLVFCAFRLFGTFKKWYIQDISVSFAQLAQKVLDIGIPAYAEGVVPAPKYWISRLELKVGFSLVAPKT